MNDAIKPLLLLVEDNDDDVFLMRRALRAAAIDLPLRVAGDGQQAVDYLKGEGAYADRVAYPLPALVFLDLKLPYKDGFEVLMWIRSTPPYVGLPVVVLTSSPEERDRRRAAQLAADHYCVKPPGREMLLKVMQTLTDAPRAS